MSSRGYISLIALMATTLATFLAPVTALAQEKTDDVYVRVNGTVDLGSNKGVDTLVAVNSEARVAGTVRDTLVIVNQTATVSGDVGRDAVVANGMLRLEPTANIGGDEHPFAVGLEQHRDRGRSRRGKFPHRGRFDRNDLRPAL